MSGFAGICDPVSLPGSVALGDKGFCRGEDIDDESIEGVTSVIEAVVSLASFEFEVSDARRSSSTC